MKFIALFIFTLVAGLVVVNCGDGKSNTNPPVVSTPSTPSPNGWQTPKGIKLNITSLLDPSIQAEMDASLTKLFADVKGRGYSQRMTHSAYTITIKDDCVNRNGTMVFKLRADNYNGTEYDQNPDPNIGEIFAAEQVKLPSNPSEFVICRDSVATMKNTTRYGAEHIILYYNNRAEYDRTATHLTSGHPIIPEL